MATGKTKRNFHESFAEHDEVQGPSNRNFGFTVGGIFTAIAVIKAVFFSFSWLAGLFFIIGGGLVAAAAIKPECLTKANAAWMKLALILFHVVNPVIMFLMFTVVFVPVGIIMKLIGYDPMRRELEPETTSYWIKKEKNEEIKKPMKYQF